ncbi:hypothetical protein FHS29_006528 [Saccharothrix tamanrassetensis]|uniref:DUF2891 family protein n=1 Tax=Saccharothrix tamanrassetensis TaxID=1051531 RepID=A0A841CX18_9PSEU|nr:DUF2891 domain-containing protein [Saccharothrix tamanrassetensis]MBB5959906.1 hypothetical protein [Saccharothrix tamanrassetensis]
MPGTRMDGTALDDDTATRLLSAAVANVLRDAPVHWTHVITDDAGLVPQRVLHPVFAGSLDWHSCVHQTWLAVRLLRLRPHLPGADEARQALTGLITPEGCRTEADFFTGPNGGFWERPYGWAWLLVLDAELRTWAATPQTPEQAPPSIPSSAQASVQPSAQASARLPAQPSSAQSLPAPPSSAQSSSAQPSSVQSPSAQPSPAQPSSAQPSSAQPSSVQWSSAQSSARLWAEHLRPLRTVLRDRYLEWVSHARLPIRAGTHANTAFATGMVLDAANAVGDTELSQACSEAALRWHREDRDYGGFEPDAADFLSPALTEADLMRRVLPDFPSWFEAFLPNLGEARWEVLREPVPIDDPGDPYGSHLVGLALSRAWNWRAIAAALPPDHRYAELARTAATAHEEAGRRHVFGHGYYAEHWLGTFATYLSLNAF